MKKVFLIIVYWVAAIVLTALLLVSLNYDWVQAAAMSLTFLPSAMALSFFLPKVDRSKSRKGRILDSMYIILGVMTKMGPFTYYRLQPDIIHLKENESLSCDEGDSWVFADDVLARISGNTLVALAKGTTYVQKLNGATNTILAYKVIIESGDLTKWFY